jgi:hypothetical protein
MGCVLFAVIAVTNSNFDWHRYTSIVGLIVLACAFSWGLSALAAIGFQTFRRLRRGPTRRNWTGPRDRIGGQVVRLPERPGRGGGHELPSFLLLAGAVVVGVIGSYFLFHMLPRGADAGLGVDVYRDGGIAQLGRGNGGKTPPAAGRSRGGYSLCSSIIRHSCVIDGDTIRYEWTKIRIADIDTPEISQPKCASEAELGHRAKDRLLELLNEGSFEVVHPGGRDEDVYGRKLRVLMRDGRSLGMVLVDEGLARRWTGSRRSWCV